MNTYSTFGPWPENPDSDYLLADLIEALALERVTLEQEILRRPVNAPRKPAFLRDRRASNEGDLSMEMEHFGDCFKKVGTLTRFWPSE